MKRRLKPVKDLSVLIVAPRRHDQQLWAELLKNCEIKHPVMTSDITYAATLVGSGQADVVFVDESYGAQGIANVLIPARNVEFSGGRGVCLILCSKQATAQDVMNAKRLGFASLIILPASTGTVQKHLELAARYIPPSDEQLGWSKPKPKDATEGKAMPAAKAEPSSGASGLHIGDQGFDFSKSEGLVPPSGQANSSMATAQPHSLSASASASAIDAPVMPSEPLNETQTAPSSGNGNRDQAEADEAEEMQAPGRSGQGAEEEVVFL